MISKLIDKIKKYSPPWSRYYLGALCAEMTLGEFKIFKEHFLTFFVL